jgi:hypothetical protein
MIASTISRARLRDLVCLSRGQPTDAGGAGLHRLPASRRRAVTDTAGIAGVTSARPRAASSRPEEHDLMASTINRCSSASAALLGG